MQKKKSVGRTVSESMHKVRKEVDRMTSGFERVFGKNMKHPKDAVSSMDGMMEKVADSYGRADINEKIRINRDSDRFFSKKEKRGYF